MGPFNPGSGLVTSVLHFGLALLISDSLCKVVQGFWFFSSMLLVDTMLCLGINASI